MKKRLSIVEIILLMNLSIFVILSVIIAFVVNKGDTLKIVNSALDLTIGVFTKSDLMSSILLITVVLLMLAFTAYWVVNIILYKKLTVGPLYLFLFFFFFLYTNGYANLIIDVDAYLVILIMILIWLLASSIICFINYLKELKEIENGESK